jgi:hypothetical protein
MSNSEQYAFCEYVTAGPNSPWHIRQLSSVGKKCGGGADTASFCGKRVSWDLKVDISEHHLSHSCTECVRIYRELADQK